MKIETKHHNRAIITQNKDLIELFETKTQQYIGESAERKNFVKSMS